MIESRRPLQALVSLLFFCAACAGPESEPLDASAVSQAVSERGQPTDSALREAFSLYRAPPLNLSADGNLNPSGQRFWHVAAAAFQSDVRRLRREERRLFALVPALGAPNRTRGQYMLDDFGDLDLQNQVAITLDILTLLGVGPKVRAGEAAVVRARFAAAQLEQSVWQAVYAVDRALVALSAAQRREAALTGLVEEAREDIRRLEFLSQRGRIAAGIYGRAQGVFAMLQLDLRRRNSDTVFALQALAQASGLPPGSPSLTAVDDSWVQGEVSRPGAAPSGAQLLNSVPLLRAVRLGYAVAEAELRVAAATAWPNIGIGPRLKATPDDFLFGGALMLDLPWPSEVEARIAAAVERRAQAREAVEDQLVVAMNAVQANREALIIAQAAQRNETVRLEAESQRAWRGMRARFSIGEGASVVDAWVDALQLRARGIIAEIDAREQVHLLDLGFREAAGLPPGIAGKDR